MVVNAVLVLRNWVHGPPLAAALLLKEFESVEPGLVLVDSRTRTDVQKLVDDYRGDWGVMLRDNRCLMLDLRTHSPSRLGDCVRTCPSLLRASARPPY